MDERRTAIQLGLIRAGLSINKDEQATIDTITDSIIEALDELPPPEPSYYQIRAAVQTHRNLKLATDDYRMRAAFEAAARAPKEG